VNDWTRIRAFYRENDAEILKEERCDWGIDAYAWDNGMLDMTPIERWLWHDIRGCNAIFYPQYPVGRYFVDFANPKAKVAIECDGHAYHLDKEKDRLRDAELEAMGWTVYRITGSDCATEYDEETRTPSRARDFVKGIAERHRLSRHHSAAKAGDWFHFGAEA
jgi:very-short-patch-repair endonuclease